jgi:hypothetical protein
LRPVTGVTKLNPSIINSVSSYNMNRCVMLAISNKEMNFMSSTCNILFGLCKYLIVLPYYRPFRVRETGT